MNFKCDNCGEPLDQCIESQNCAISWRKRAIAFKRELESLKKDHAKLLRDWTEAERAKRILQGTAFHVQKESDINLEGRRKAEREVGRLRDRLNKGRVLDEKVFANKYSHRYANLTEGQIAGMIWLLGEFEARSSPRDWDYDVAYPGERRKIGALRALSEFSRNPMTITEVRHYIHKVVRPKREPPKVHDWFCYKGEQVQVEDINRRINVIYLTNGACIEMEKWEQLLDEPINSSGLVELAEEARRELAEFGELEVEEIGTSIDLKVLVALCSLRDDLDKIGAGGWKRRVVEIINLVTGKSSIELAEDARQELSELEEELNVEKIGETKLNTITLDLDELSFGKYTRWAKNLTADQFNGLLWLIGEFMVRAYPSDYDYTKEIGGRRRKIAALRAIAEFDRDPLGFEESLAWIRAAARPARTKKED